MEYKFSKSSTAKTIYTLLEDWGEVIFHTASGQVAEVHKGDSGEVTDEYIHFIDSRGDEHYIFYDQVERITTHRASVEE